MSRHLAGAGLLVVSGVSGAGKSSLLRAGVLPRIRADGLAAAPGAASWPCLVFTPTRAPLDELALRVASLAGADASAVRRGLAADPAGFALTARQAALARPRGPVGDSDGLAPERDQPAPQQRLLLVVDQFEELFTQCADEGQRRAFITALHAAATAGHGPDQAPAALVVLGVRADFEARCADYPELADAVQDRYLVTAMTGRQLRMAITEPAKKADSGVDDDLVEVLLAEVRTGQPGTFGAGMLPLLSHALDQAWRSRAGQVLTLADYERTGGIEGAVAASAQRAYDRLTPAQQAAARQVFTRLTATSGEGVDTADRATRAELTEGKSASRGPGRGGGAGGLRRRTAAHPRRRHRGNQPRGAADRLAAAARHLAGRNPRRPDRPHPAAHHRRRLGPPLPRSVLPLQRQPAGGRHRHRRPDRRRPRPPPPAQPDRTRLPPRQQPCPPPNRTPAAGRDRWPSRSDSDSRHRRRDRGAQRRQRHAAARPCPIPPARRRKPRPCLHQSRDRPAARRRRLARLPHRPGRFRHHDLARRATAKRHAARRPVHRARGGVQPRRQAAGQRRRRWHGAAVEPGHRPARRRTSPRHQQPERRARGGVQPPRQPAGQRRRRWHGAAVEPGQRPPRRRDPPRHPRPVGASGRRARGGVQPRWQAAGQRGRRWHGAAVEPGHRPPRRNPPRHQQPVRRVRGGVQPRWQAAGQRRRRRHGAAVGSAHRPPRWRAPPHHQHRGRRARGGVQPRWQAAGQRRRRRHGAAMGCGHRPPCRNP